MWLATGRLVGRLAGSRAASGLRGRGLHPRLEGQHQVARAKTAGLHAMSYTVNEVNDAQRFFDLGLDVILTNRVDLFAPGAKNH